MPDPPAVPTPPPAPRAVARSRGSWSGALRAALAFLGGTVLRLYAVALMALILWLTWLAFRYLLNSLLVASPPPPQVVGLPLRLDEALLQKRRAAFPAIDAAEHPRSPLAHYHRFEGWIQPDPFNDCARGGCHAPLPHARSKEVRAFLNMHATSIHCGVCHVESSARPLSLVWYDLDEGRSRAAPSILQAYQRIVALRDQVRTGEAPTPAQRDGIESLLRAAAREADGLPAFESLADHFAATRTSSSAFAPLLDAARSTLERHFRGDYGAKLALRDAGSDQPLLGHPRTQEAVRAYLERGAQADPTERERLLAAVHPLRRSAALRCDDCHRPQDGLVDFAAAGYPEARVRSLTGSVVVRMIEHIAQGRPMHLPRFVVPARDGTQPATRPAGP